jgi:hypothetical protein
MKKLPQMITCIALAVLFAACNANQKADMLFGKMSKADLVMGNLKREFRDAGGKYEVIVRFTPGRDANDRTIVHYVFHVMNVPDERELWTFQKHSKICSGKVCEIALYSASSKKEAAEVSILAGFHSTINVRFMNSPGTLRADGSNCESEDVNNCTCFPCSFAPPARTVPNIEIPEHVKEILEIQNREHLHTGWIMLVE